MALNVAVLVYTVLQFIAFVLVLVATPIEMFRINHREGRVRGFLTLWGARVMSGNSTFESQTRSVWVTCPRRLMRFRVAESFAIISILVYGVAFVLGVIMLFCCSWLRFVCLTLNIVGAVTVGIVWALMVVTYFTVDDPCPDLRSYTLYGVGFSFFVAAWVLDVLNIFLLALSFSIPAFRELDSVNDKSEGKSKEESQQHGSHKQEEDEDDDEYE